MVNLVNAFLGAALPAAGESIQQKELQQRQAEIQAKRDAKLEEYRRANTKDERAFQQSMLTSQRAYGEEQAEKAFEREKELLRMKYGAEREKQASTFASKDAELAADLVKAQDVDPQTGIDRNTGKPAKNTGQFLEEITASKRISPEAKAKIDLSNDITKTRVNEAIQGVDLNREALSEIDLAIRDVNEAAFILKYGGAAKSKDGEFKELAEGEKAKPLNVTGPILNYFESIPTLREDGQRLQTIFKSLSLDRLDKIKGTPSDKDLETVFQAGPNEKLYAGPALNALEKQARALQSYKKNVSRTLKRQEKTLKEFGIEDTTPVEPASPQPAQDPEREARLKRYEELKRKREQNNAAQ